jgi:hypothetical protein
MSGVNTAVVRRTWGLLQTRDAALTSYGDSFDYDEFMALPSIAMALFVSTLLAFGVALLRWFSPVRVNICGRTVRLLTIPGSGTVVLLVEDTIRFWTFSRVRIYLPTLPHSFLKSTIIPRILANGWYTGVNVTSSLSDPPRHVQTTLKIKGDPGYAGAAGVCTRALFVSQCSDSSTYLPH